jgi:hypothetical protein
LKESRQLPGRREFLRHLATELTPRDIPPIFSLCPDLKGWVNS